MRAAMAIHHQRGRQCMSSRAQSVDCAIRIVAARPDGGPLIQSVNSRCGFSAPPFARLAIAQRSKSPASQRNTIFESIYAPRLGQTSAIIHLPDVIAAI